MRVDQAKEAVQRGNVAAAHEHLDMLLSIAPSNIEALKLKAALLRLEGNYEVEHELWRQVHDLDSSDNDSLSYMLRRQREEREFCYFTDVLPTGRKFLAYPKSVAEATVVGFFGCMLFLILSYAIGAQKFFANQALVLVLFILCVIVPWLLIIYRYLTSLVYVAVTDEAIGIKSRLRYLDLRWQDISKVYLTHSHDSSSLDVVILPTDKLQPMVKINVTDGISSLCAKTFLIAEIKKYAQLESLAYEKLQLDRDGWVEFS